MKNAKSIKNSESLPFFGIPAVLPYIAGMRNRLVLMSLLGLLGTALDVLMPIFQRYALNHFVGGGTLDTLPIFIVIYIFSIVVCGVLNYFGCTMATANEVRANEKLRNAAFSHLQTLSLSYYNQNSVGVIHSRLMSDTSKIGSLFSWTIFDAVFHLTYLLGSVVIMLVTDYKLGLLVMTVLPVIVILFSFFQRSLVRVNREIRETNAKITSNFNEGITGAKTIKSLVIEDKMERDFVRETNEMRSRSVHAAKLRGVFSATTNLASSAALALVLWKGGYIAANEIGTFSMFMSYAAGMMEPVRWIIDAISDLIVTRVNIERYYRLMTTEPEVLDSIEVVEKYGDCFQPKKENWETLNGDIEFEDVTFRYPDGEENVLEHFNLKIPYGTNVAIVGETGAGKSTLVNLVCRFYEPTSGRILIDGRDVRERSQLWLHSSLGYVLQTPQLFSGSVRENLLYGNPNATEEELNKALKLTTADEVVARLEHGLDTDVGEGGGMLSTGEKQLLCLTRAILADSRILILDEATASVDTLTEQRVQHAIDFVIRGRTSLVIAHRLSTVRNADIILVVDDGKIIEQGNHQELLEKKGYYYSLYTRQYDEETASQFFG